MWGDWGIEASLFSNLYVDAVQETHFIWVENCEVLEKDYRSFSICKLHCTVSSLKTGRSLDVDINLVFAGDGGRLVVEDSGLCARSRWGETLLLFVVGTVPLEQGTHSSSGGLECDCWLRIRVGRGPRGSVGWENNLITLMAE